VNINLIFYKNKKVEFQWEDEKRGINIYDVNS